MSSTSATRSASTPPTRTASRRSATSPSRRSGSSSAAPAQMRGRATGTTAAPSRAADRGRPRPALAGECSANQDEPPVSLHEAAQMTLTTPKRAFTVTEHYGRPGESDDRVQRRQHGGDWEQRVNFDRLRTDRLARARRALEASELGSVLLFDQNNIR